MKLHSGIGYEFGICRNETGSSRGQRFLLSFCRILNSDLVSPKITMIAFSCENLVICPVACSVKVVDNVSWIASSKALFSRDLLPVFIAVG